MAEKISMLIVKVDLDCHKCYDKMRKILCKLQDQERIRTISFDDKSKIIAIAGPFDPQRLACKIRCRGGKTVKDIQIMDVGGGNGKPTPKMADQPPPPAHVNNGEREQENHPPAEPPPPEPSPPPEPAPAPAPDRPPSPPPQPATSDWRTATRMPAFHEEDEPQAQPAQLEPPPPPAAQPPLLTKPRPLTPPPRPKPPEQYPVECVIPPVEIPSWPAAPVGPCGCPCCEPCYQGYYEGCRCGCGGGGRVYSFSAAGPPAAAWCEYRGCRIVNEEDPNAACSIM